MTVSLLLPPGKDWLDAVEAIATPSIALLAAYFAWLAYRLEKRRRADELYDRRLEFYSSFSRRINEEIRETLRGLTSEEAKYSFEPLLDEWAAKSAFLFPRDVERDIRALRNFDFHGWIERYDFSERPIDDIFLRHMRFRE